MAKAAGWLVAALCGFWMLCVRCDDARLEIEDWAACSCGALRILNLEGNLSGIELAQRRQLGNEHTLLEEAIGATTSATFAFVFDDPQSGLILDRSEIGANITVFHAAEFSRSTATDFGMIMERAAEIHVIDSCFTFLPAVLRVPATTRKVLHRYASLAQRAQPDGARCPLIEHSLLPSLIADWQILEQPRSARHLDPQIVHPPDGDVVMVGSEIDGDRAEKMIVFSARKVRSLPPNVAIVICHSLPSAAFSSPNGCSPHGPSSITFAVTAGSVVDEEARCPSLNGVPMTDVGEACEAAVHMDRAMAGAAPGPTFSCLSVRVGSTVSSSVASWYSLLAAEGALQLSERSLTPRGGRDSAAPTEGGASGASVHGVCGSGPKRDRATCKDEGNTCDDAWVTQETKGGSVTVTLAQILEANTGSAARQRTRVGSGRVLVIALGEARGGDDVHRSIQRHLVSRLQADLAVFFTTLSQSSRLRELAQIRWTMPELTDFCCVLDLLERNCAGRSSWAASLTRQSTCKSAHNIRYVTALLLAMRKILKQVMSYFDVWSQYDYFVLTRADYAFACDHPTIAELAAQHGPGASMTGVWVPRGESYGGVTDRHMVAHAGLFVDALEAWQDLVCASTASAAAGVPEHTNIETRLLRWLNQSNISVHGFNGTMFTVRHDNEHARKAKGVQVEPLSTALRLKVKYLGEYQAAMLACGADARTLTDRLLGA